MKIGLVRHFKVQKEYPRGRRFSASEVEQWFREYDVADIEEGAVDLGGIEWSRCFTSTMPRARLTAEKIYDGTILVKAELKEIPAPKFSTKLKLPFIAWFLLIRLSLFLNRQTRMDVKQAQERIRMVLDEAITPGGGDVLIVSHGALMIFMGKELLKRGFRGPKLKYPANGKLHVYKN